MLKNSKSRNSFVVKETKIVSQRTWHLKYFFDDVQKRDRWAGLEITMRAKEQDKHGAGGDGMRWETSKSPVGLELKIHLEKWEQGPKM